MSRRSRAAYFAQLERVYSRCEWPRSLGGCGKIGARFSDKDRLTLCKAHRAQHRANKCRALWLVREVLS